MTSVETLQRPVAVFSRRFLPASMTWIQDELNLDPLGSAFPACWMTTESTLASDIMASHTPEVLGIGSMAACIASGRLGTQRLKAHLPPTTHAIHAHFLGLGLELAQPLERMGLPLTISCHGYDISLNRRELWRGGPAHKTQVILETLRPLPDVLYHSVSRVATSRMLERGIASHQIEEIELGIDISRFTAENRIVRDIDLLFVGRLVEKKNPLGFVELAAHLGESRKVNAVIAGAGPLAFPAKELAKRLGTTITFVGETSRAETSTLLKRSKVLCMPGEPATTGDLETFGLVFIEAMASGVVPVAYDYGGAAEALRFGGGTLVTLADRSELASAVDSYLSSEQLRTETALEGRRVVETRFDARRQVPLILEAVRR